MERYEIKGTLQIDPYGHKNLSPRTGELPEGAVFVAGAVVWLDRHHMLAGDVNKQIAKTIRLQDVVVIVLSENSVKSDWVEHDLEMARNKERDENRDVLCPVFLDESWKHKLDDPLWRQLKKKFVIDFSAWETDEFKPQFDRLLGGIKQNYEIWRPEKKEKPPAP